jgi:hypothetical protein
VRRVKDLYWLFVLIILVGALASLLFYRKS